MFLLSDVEGELERDVGRGEVAVVHYLMRGGRNHYFIPPTSLRCY